MDRKIRMILGLLVWLVAGCASSGSSSSDSSGYLWPESDEASEASGHAFTASGMHFRKTMPARKPTAEQSWDFYYKHCSMNGNETHFSKTSYDCTGPYH